MKKRIVTLLMVVLLLAALPGTALAASGITVTVNGTDVRWTDAAPFIDSNSRTMVPLRAVGEALGLTVDWNGAAREAIFTDGTKTIYFPIDSKFYKTQNGGTVAMDTAAVIVSSRTYAPVRYLAEYFGYTVGWDGATRTVGITGGTPAPAPIPTPTPTPSSEPRWVLVDSSAEPAADTNNEYHKWTHTYLGEFDGMVRFQCSGGFYQDAGHYYHCDAYFECEQPPAALKPGQSLTLEMRFWVENYEWAGDSGAVNQIMLGSNWITDGGYFLDEQGEKYLQTKNNSAGGTTGNIEKKGYYTKTVRDSSVIGSKYEIKFASNSAGTYTWTYELQE